MPCFIIIEGIEFRIRLFFDSVYAAIMWGYPWLKRVFGKVILSSISPNNNFNNCPQKVMYTAFAKQDNCYDGFIYLKWRMQYILLYLLDIIYSSLVTPCHAGFAIRRN